ncbi:MAG: hypothetical protein FJX68_03030 [Alphaproteobacteria bacterium]|nr:hypothetical protein [Alphaproteobacteria bacterium]
MSEWLGNDLGVFLGLTVVLFGAAAWMTGQALSETWRSFWHALPYSLLLAITNRFLGFALFEGELLSLSGLVSAWVVLLGLAALAFWLARVHLMCRQYPWLYERAGLFAWRARREGDVT